MRKSKEKKEGKKKTKKKKVCVVQNKIKADY
jgi:hypothetical protein